MHPAPNTAWGGGRGGRHRRCSAQKEATDMPSAGRQTHDAASEVFPNRKPTGPITNAVFKGKSCGSGYLRWSLFKRLWR